MARLTVETPFGPFTIRAEGEAIVQSGWGRTQDHGAPGPLLREAARQLAAYCTAKLRRFDLPLAANGSEFHRRVWAEIAAIPYGEVGTYGGIAKALGVNARSIGRGCGSNPIAVIVPCHRVVGAGGTLGGYSGGQGLATKRQLLVHEGVTVTNRNAIVRAREPDLFRETLRA